AEEAVILKIRTDPSGAGVYLNDKDYGSSPVQISDLDTGTYKLELRKSGYYRRKAKVRIESFGVTELDFDLLQPATLVITSDPPQASVSIDGKSEGKTPYKKKMRPGEYSIALNLKGYENVEKNISLESGVEDTLVLSLEAQEVQAEGKKKKSFWNPGFVLISFFIFTAVLIGIEKTSI
ncbi:MAG: PEGA domain-containing protein, partial [Chitinispirillaceae bacterium]